MGPNAGILQLVFVPLSAALNRPRADWGRPSSHDLQTQDIRGSSIFVSVPSSSISSLTMCLHISAVLLMSAFCLRAFGLMYEWRWRNCRHLSSANRMLLSTMGTPPPDSRDAEANDTVTKVKMRVSRRRMASKYLKVRRTHIRQFEKILCACAIDLISEWTFM